MKGKTKTQKGITLIALIITIVVLLILASVAISSIQNDGIVLYAQNSAKDYNQSVANEQQMLDKYMDYLNNAALKTETLKIVPTTNYPDPKTFVYTEVSTNGSAYTVAKKSTIAGGLLSMNFDENVCNNFEIKIYLFDKNGNPYYLTDLSTRYFEGDLRVASLWQLPGAEAGFSQVKKSFTTPIPEDCTVMVCLRGMSHVFESPNGSITTQKGFSEWVCNGGVEVTMSNTKTSISAINPNVKSIAHRGYYNAPENTLAAFEVAKHLGFDYVELDVQFTSDGVPVLLHDLSINRTARNADGSKLVKTVNVADITYEQALEYDFGVYKAKRFAGEKIPTFDECIALCKELDIHPYIEFKSSINEERLNMLFDILDKYGMRNDVTWISFYTDTLEKTLSIDSNARLGYLCSSLTESKISNILNLQNENNEVFVNLQANYISDEIVSLCKNNDIPLEVWNILNENNVATYCSNEYISGITCDMGPAGAILDKVLE